MIPKPQYYAVLGDAQTLQQAESELAAAGLPCQTGHYAWPDLLFISPWFGGMTWCRSATHANRDYREQITLPRDWGRLREVLASLVLPTA
jgi:hypothetical protein